MALGLEGCYLYNLVNQTLKERIATFILCCSKSDVSSDVGTMSSVVWWFIIGCLIMQAESTIRGGKKPAWQHECLNVPHFVPLVTSQC